MELPDDCNRKKAVIEKQRMRPRGRYEVIGINAKLAAGCDEGGDASKSSYLAFAFEVVV